MIPEKIDTSETAKITQKVGHYDLDGMPPLKFRDDRTDRSDANVNICITPENRTILANRISLLLADSYSLYLMTQNFHWNVTGENFLTLHKLFEHQYKELAESIDEVAERIRALGFHAPGTFSEFQSRTSISEVANIPEPEQMIELLLSGYEVLIGDATQIAQIAQEAQDLPSADLSSRLSYKYQKAAWMLRSHLQQKTQNMQHAQTAH